MKYFKNICKWKWIRLFYNVNLTWIYYLENQHSPLHLLLIDLPWILKNVKKNECFARGLARIVFIDIHEVVKRGVLVNYFHSDLWKGEVWYYMRAAARREYCKWLINAIQLVVEWIFPTRKLMFARWMIISYDFNPISSKCVSQHCIFLLVMYRLRDRLVFFLVIRQ